MQKFYTLFVGLYLCSFGASAQFSGPYAPANWTVATPPPSNGSVNTGGAPASIIITGSDGGGAGTDVDTDFTITTKGAGIFSFSWSYHSNDSYNDASYDPAGVLIGSDFIQLTDDGGAVDQSGTYTSGYLPAGTVIGFRIRATDNVEGDATFSIANFTPPVSTLPVTLEFFTAQPLGPQVKLAWRTATEENSDRFEVQRSANGRDYAVIATVAARHQAAHTTDYTALDPAPLPGTTYYRLRMVDRDDSYSYSPVATVKRAATTGVQLYPNPAGRELFLTLTGGSTPVAETVQVFNAAGSLQWSKTISLAPGTNRVPLDVSALDKGVYFLRLGQGGASHFFVKQ